MFTSDQKIKFRPSVHDAAERCVMRDAQSVRHSATVRADGADLPICDRDFKSGVVRGPRRRQHQRGVRGFR